MQIKRVFIAFGASFERNIITNNSFYYCTRNYFFGLDKFLSQFFGYRESYFIYFINILSKF